MHGASRFAPSTTGRAHPGTWLAALLSWLDARQQDKKWILRLEDLDPTRSTPEKSKLLEDDIRWLGLDWDLFEKQSLNQVRYESTMDELQALGLLYPCNLSRKEIQAFGKKALNGGWIYPNISRNRQLPAAGWRTCTEIIRLKLPDVSIEFHDDANETTTYYPPTDFGDPVIRRRDGAFSYHFASVVDDISTKVDRIVRGRDLMDTTPLQIALFKILGKPIPTYRHHLLFLEKHKDKLSKYHGATGGTEIRKNTRPNRFCGELAHISGILPEATPITPSELVEKFDWLKVLQNDILVEWQPNPKGSRLVSK
ncbi:MAG: glutamate--tRNA ligase family protein [Myxococcota bacterium]|nr:glutamate--tRNA ligase family protein [Myxococcota bacterium]